MRVAGWVAAFAGVLLLSGCLIVPVSYTQPGSRHNVSDTTGKALQPGITTLEDVFLQLGEPDYVSPDGRRLGYAWTKVQALLIVVTYGSPAPSAELGKTSLLEVSFDSEGRVEASRVISKGMFGTAVTPETLEGGQPPPSPHK
ncbi:MAG TPA: hypothetical protein VMT50_04525 [Steroidobacteraceae bacterium]|nr:hypothetical protein [Steroidobacteraceae bacterium]